MKTLKPKTRAAVLAIAQWQEGVLETPSGSNCVKYNTEYYGGSVRGGAYPWCVAFIWWVFKEAGFNLYKTASCSSLVNRYKAFSPSQVVKEDYAPGDIVFFDFSGNKRKTEHCGIVLGVDGDTLTTIEGNTSTGSDSNGGAVMKRERNVKLVTCAVRPTYKD